MIEMIEMREMYDPVTEREKEIGEGIFDREIDARLRGIRRGPGQGTRMGE